MDTPPPPKRPHSGLGIASCILGIISGTTFFIFAMISFVADLSGAVVTVATLGVVVRPSAQEQLMPVLVMTGAGIVLALGFGVAGLMQDGRKKLWAIMGCIISAIAALPMLEMLGII